MSPTIPCLACLLSSRAAEFQRLYTPTAFREERILWRSVIQLNLVRSVRTILEAVQDARRGRTRITSDDESDSEEQLALSDELDSFQLRLLALRHAESLLISKLVPPNEEEATRLGNGYAPGGGTSWQWRNQEVFVRPTSLWKGKERSSNNNPMDRETMEEITDILYQCRHDMIDLWLNPSAREILRRRKLRLEESPGLSVRPFSLRLVLTLVGQFFKRSRAYMLVELRA